LIAHGLTPILKNVGGVYGASIAWFEKLGWRKLWEYGDPPTFGAVAAAAPARFFLCLDGQGGPRR
jgi:hypothetical protein